MSPLPGIITNAMLDAAKKTKPYADQPITMEQQKVSQTTLEQHVEELYNKLQKEFNQTLLDLWPDFDLDLRAVNIYPEEWKKEFFSFRIVSLAV